MDEKKRQEQLEKKQRKAARERERYQAARRAGFTAAEAKSITKTLEGKPELVQDIAVVSPTVAKGITNLTEIIAKLGQPLTPGKPIKAPKPKFVAPKPHVPLTAKQRELNKQAGAFKRFLRRNPALSQRQALEEWRKRGHTMSTERGADIYRGIRGTAKAHNKRTRYKTYGLDDSPEGQYFLKSRYMYLMEYECLVSGTGMDETRYMWIASDVKLTKLERKERVLDAYDNGELDQNEYYLAIYVYEDSIRTVYVVDTQKRSAKFKAFESKSKQANPDWSISRILREYRVLNGGGSNA
ncbi:hypothetical protein MKY96_33760 [Paenibacillus sp. FSL R7-0302]|uniref:hypothetical protein n=1 Tax=Paenibacillus sp. FSL R7-0302 TaxID=2921681 RepID=UPI0030F7CE31